MTEILKTTERPPLVAPPAQRPDRLGPATVYGDDIPLFSPGAFFAALILAPLAVTLAGALAIIPVFALFFGAPFYLLAGTPALLWAVGRYPLNGFAYALLGAVLNVAGGAIALPILWMDIGFQAAAEDVAFYFGFGTIFGAIWCAVFALFYGKFHPDYEFKPG